MTLTQEEVKHIGNLARLELTEAEVARFQQELSAIIDYISQLSKIKTKSVAPTFQTTGLTNVWRSDTVLSERVLTTPAALKNAPEHDDQYFKVKPVF